jgi:hypothetical protein
MNRKEAQAAGEALLTQLGNQWHNWRINVWENLGWHAEILSPCGRLKVRRIYTGQCVAYLGEATSAGGFWVGSGATPSAAIESAVAQGKAALKFHEDLLRGL